MVLKIKVTFYKDGQKSERDDDTLNGLDVESLSSRKHEDDIQKKTRGEKEKSEKRYRNCA